uniref:protein LONGIFOLIA 2-like n=1 Tax=Erigeron canadensis TaxID=72917 RepID=UPI001CB8E262|nr:protein LONGIFOLIA 2-like [Erigeron canadensis]
MSTKEVVLTLKDDKQELQKQLGCMSGLFQIFDRRYLLGQRRRHGQNQKRLLPGQIDKDEKELKNESEKPKEKTPKVVTKEKRVSVELPRNSFSSSSSSTAVSSLDCSKRVQTEHFSSSQSVISEPASTPFLPRKQPELFMQSPDIRDVVKECMIREPRVVSIKKGVKEERVGPTMKYVDSPRPLPHQKPVQYDGIDRNLAKLREIQWGVDKVKEISRFSCDGRESRYQLKSNMKVKELPRLSLDSRQVYLSNSSNDPVNNKRPSSSVVARLMGLETLTASIDDNQTSKTKSEESVSNSKSLRKEVEIKHDRSSVSPRVRREPISPLRGVKVSHVITKISLETAPWKQEGGRRGQQKPPFKGKEGPAKTEPASPSIYGEIEKRLTDHEFKTTGKDLRALKQILEAMQKTKKRLENKEQELENCSIGDRQSQKSDQQVSPKINVISPCKVKHTHARKELVGRRQLKEPILRDKKSTGRLLPLPDYSATASPKMQRSKNSIHGPSSDLSRPKKQPSMQRSRNPKVKSMDTLHDSETRNLSQLSDTVSFQSESYSLASQNDSEVSSTEWVQELTSPYRPKENHRSIVAERFYDEKSAADHAKHTMEQPSPVSVLDAFYMEDTPSPVKKKIITFNDDENLHFEEVQDQAMVNNLGSSTNLDQYAEINNIKLKSIKHLVHQIELLNANTDNANGNNTATSPYEDKAEEHRYIEEILLASGCLKDLVCTTTIIQLQPTRSLINPELFHVLEKTKGCTDHGYHKKNMRSKIGRKLVFDTVNDVLGNKLAMIGPFGPYKGRVLNRDKLLKELCSGIDGLQSNSERGIYDEDDEVLNIMNADVNKRSQDWEEYCDQVPGLVLDIERLIFKDLISEVVNGQVTGLQDWQVRPHCRQLFPL